MMSTIIYVVIIDSKFFIIFHYLSTTCYECLSIFYHLGDLLATLSTVLDSSLHSIDKVKGMGYYHVIVSLQISSMILEFLNQPTILDQLFFL